MTLEMIIKILVAYSRLLTFLNDNGYDETIANIKVIEDLKLQITLNDHMGNSYDVVVWVDNTGELHVENPVSHQSFFDVAEEFNMTPIDVEYIKFGDKSIYYTMKNSK